MALPLNINRRVEQLWRQHSTKSAIARVLLDEGYSVAAIAKAVPMAYSQVHSIAAKIGTTKPQPVRIPLGRTTKVQQQRERHETVKAARKAQADVDRILARERANEAAGRPAGTGAKSRVGKLRTGNLPSDRNAGECANCGFDLVIRKTPVGFVFVHVNTTTEEYLSTVQFCQAVPRKLL